MFDYCTSLIADCIGDVRVEGAAFISNYSSQVRGPYTFNVVEGHNKFLFEECSDWPLILKNYVAVIRSSGSGSGPIAMGPVVDGDLMFEDFENGTILLNPLEEPIGQNRVLYLQLIIYYIPIGDDMIGLYLAS